MKYSRVGAIDELESAQVLAHQQPRVAPLFASKESQFAYISTSGKVL